MQSHFEKEEREKEELREQVALLKGSLRDSEMLQGRHKDYELMLSDMKDHYER